MLENIAELLAVTGENRFRVRAYTEAARAISAMSEDVSDLHHSGHLTDMPGVGPSIAAKVGEYLNTGSSSYYAGLKRHMPATAAMLNHGPLPALLAHLGRRGRDAMDTTDTATTTEHNDECPACGGPALHPGVCVDQDGYVLPAYAELAEMWQEQGRPVLTEDDLSDLEEMLNATDEERRAT